MTSQSENNGLNSLSSLPRNESMEAENSRVDTEIQDKNDDVCVIKKKRKKTSEVWFDFDDVEDPKLGRKAVCKHCKDRFAYGGKGSSTSHLKRHADSCFQKKLKNNTSTKQSTIPFKSSTSSMNPFLVPGAKYSNEKMREIIASSIMVHEHQTYLEESVYIPDGSSNTFCALEWWRNNSLRYKILSKMAADILAIPVSTVASEATFSVGGRVIDDYRASLNEESIEALICGGDWLRTKFGLKRKKVLDLEQEMI